MRFVDLQTAKRSQGIRLVMLKGAPSPWSQAAMAIFEIKGIDVLGVWMSPGDPAITSWTGVPNAPVVIFDEEPPRAHWADILALSERLAPAVPLLPLGFEQRVRAFGLCNEVMGHDGLVWNMRLSLIDLSIATRGARGYSLAVAQHLAARYGYSAGCGAAAGTRLEEILTALDSHLQRGRPYYFGDRPSALDIYSAAALDALAPLPHALCPMHPKTRAALEAWRDSADHAIPARLLEHRERMHSEYMPLPMQC